MNGYGERSFCGWPLFPFWLHLFFSCTFSIVRREREFFLAMTLRNSFSKFRKSLYFKGFRFPFTKYNSLMCRMPGKYIKLIYVILPLQRDNLY